MATYRNIRKVLNLPTLSESPSSGVNGEMYFNTGDLALYIYDGEWKKVTQSALPFVYQATTAGYVGLGSGSTTSIVNKMTFSSEGSASTISSNVGGNSNEFWASSSYKDGSKGYLYGGAGVLDQTNCRKLRRIDMASDTCLSSVATFLDSGNLGYEGGGNDGEKGFSAGQWKPSGTATYSGHVDVITFSNESCSASSYEITKGLQNPATVCGPTFMVYCGGRGLSSSSAGNNTRYTFNYANDANGVTQSSTLNITLWYPCGVSSSTEAFICGGRRGSEGSYAYTTQIQKFSFATDASTTDLGDITDTSGQVASLGWSQTSNGYLPGGRMDGHTATANIHRQVYANNNNMTDVGDLTAASHSNATSQI